MFTYRFIIPSDFNMFWCYIAIKYSKNLFFYFPYASDHGLVDILA